jgi:diguanylate cyclase (GGDEF)-like protein
MSGITATLVILYALPFEKFPLLVAAILCLLFPIQIFLWRLTYGRRIKDFLFCSSSLLLILFLKHYWNYSDFAFYVFAIIIPSVVHYRTFLLLTGSTFFLEISREFLYRAEPPDKIAFRYVLFAAAGSLTYLLLRDEQRLKEGYKKELDDLKYGMHQLDEPLSQISEDGQTSRKVDAVLALDHSLQNTLQLVHRIFKPDLTLLWQYIPETRELRIRNQLGDTEDLKSNFVLSMGEDPVGWAALNQKSFLQQEPEKKILCRFYQKNVDVHSFIAVPVLDQGRLEGVISMNAIHPKHFPSETENALYSFAGQISETIRMARLAKEQEELVFEFQAFYHASKELSSMIDFDEIVRKLQILCAEIVKSDFTALAVVQNEPDRYSVFEWTGDSKLPETYSDLMNSGRSWISWFLQNREEPLIFSESQLELQEMFLLRREENRGEVVTYLAVPMRHQQKCIGALVLGSRQKDAFTSHQSRILSILCNQAAVSIENSFIIRKMEVLAITDGLTELFNHRYFQESLEREIARAERQRQPLTLLLLDIDHFKGFNDSFGHPAGDFVLKSLAALLKKNARKIDILARYGGEEFAALLPGIEIKNARKTAERWRKAVQRASLKWEDKSFAVTLSIGFASYPADSENKTELIEKADRALYLAKENGRNQVRHCSENQDQRRSPLFG